MIKKNRNFAQEVFEYCFFDKKQYSANIVYFFMFL